MLDDQGQNVDDPKPEPKKVEEGQPSIEEQQVPMMPPDPSLLAQMPAIDPELYTKKENELYDMKQKEKVKQFLTDIINDIQSSSMDEQDKKTLLRYLTSTQSYATNEDKAMQAYEAIEFIIRQLNPSTFESTLNIGQYHSFTMKSSVSLGKLIFLGYVGKVNFTDCQALYWSTYHFMFLLYNRIILGNEKRYILDKMKAQSISLGGIKVQ